MHYILLQNHGIVSQYNITEIFSEMWMQFKLN